MTRDVHWIGDDHDDQAEILSALWAAARSFPQLPPDSPSELRKFTVDIDDPKKVYTIYRASRRHNFQILVERYIIQLRYGCRSSHCTTPTCFTCRQRAAGNAPLRRYNSTSARALACHLASQDNPERGLCPYVIGYFQKSHTSKIIVKAGASREDSNKRAESTKVKLQHNGSISSIYHPNGSAEKAAPTASVSTSRDTHSQLDDDRKEDFSTEIKSDQILSTVKFGQPATKIDHKSFIQNLFNTDAMKMLEWLRPNNLEALAFSYGEIRKLFSSSRQSKGNESITNNASVATEEDDLSLEHGLTKSGPRSLSPIRKAATDDFEILKGRGLPNNNEEISLPHSHPSSKFDTTNLITSTTTDEQFDDSNTAHSPQSNEEPEQHANGIYITKTFLKETNLQRQILDGMTDIAAAQQKDHKNALKVSDASLDGLSGGGMVSQQPKQPNGHSLPVRNPQVLEVLMSTNGVDEKIGSPSMTVNNNLEKFLGAHQLDVHPQSLSVLTVEIIDLLSNVLRSSQAISFENPSLYWTPSTDKDTRRTPTPIVIPSPIVIERVPGTNDQWKLFAEQSLFYVLSSPKELLKSFRDENKKLLDTQSLWYCMMRLTEVAMPLVFDSLWMVANELYLPPQELWGMYDWARKPEVEITSSDVAHIASICLHALVAAVSSLSTTTEVFNSSRIRSLGLSAQTSPQTTSKSIDLSLRQDDIFSDELALRLARRIFAAIPVRRQYQALVRYTADQHHTRQEDLLDAILAPLSFLDIEAPSVINFSAHERQMHETRMPALIIEWARAILMQDWNGRPEVPADGSFGGALAMMTAIHMKRKSLLLSDRLFRTEFFAHRLDSTEMPVEWLSFDSNNKTTHLLDYPYLFSPAILVTYFRAINFSRMSRAFEAAGSMMGRVQAFMSPGTLITDASRRDDLHEKLRIATSKFMVLQIRRTHVLHDAFNHLWRREERELSRPLKIRLGEDSGEEGSDSGGVQQEFFRLAIAEALNPDYGAFNVDERTKMIWFQPGSPEPLWKFELIGLITSLAVYNGLTLPVTFPKALYRKLLGLPVSELHHIEDGWPDLASGLTALLEWDEKDGLVSDVFSRTYEFSISVFGKEVSRDMSDPTNAHWPQFQEAKRANPLDARIVDGENRNDYVSDYIKWLTDVSIRPQFEAFQKGFLTCLERRSLSLFDPELLQSVIEGVQEIDITELRRYARYVGWDSSHRSIKDFWSIVKRYGSEEKKKLLEFVTASDRVPVGGMRNLQFVVQRNGVGDVDGRLPTSYTCYGTLLLPEYSSKDILRQKLGMALDNAKGFGFA